MLRRSLQNDDATKNAKFYVPWRSHNELLCLGDLLEKEVVEIIIGLHEFAQDGLERNCKKPCESISHPLFVF